jgi:probable HAF family extracellular repeat protein
MAEDLGTLGGEDGVAMALNDRGELVGSYGLNPHADYADRRGFIGTIKGTGTAIPTFGGRISEARDVNSVGRAIGKAQIASGDFRAFSYQAGSLADLGTLPGGTQSFAHGINNAGDIVGAADSDGMLHAFIYRNGVMTDLNTLIPPASGWVLTEARAISESRIVVGTGVFNGQQRAFQLRVNP